MGLNCSCPVGAHLPDLIIPECKESLGQVQKVIFRQITGEGIAAADLVSLTGMNALLAADDDTKIVVSPYIQNPETEPGEARAFGGGNQTINGVELILGVGPTAFTGVIYQEAQSVIKVLKEYACVPKLGVYLIDEYGNIGCYGKQTTGTPGITAMPIPISNFFVGDKNLGGFEEPDSNAIQWNFIPNWSDDLVIFKKAGGTIGGVTYGVFDYNPLTDLLNIES